MKFNTLTFSLGVVCRHALSDDTVKRIADLRKALGTFTDQGVIVGDECHVNDVLDSLTDVLHTAARARAARAGKQRGDADAVA